MLLTLDEINEFPTKMLEVLRQPIEDKVVTISRAKGSLTFPANFMLIGAHNPCPCGYYGDLAHSCYIDVQHMVEAIQYRPRENKG